MRKWRPRIKRIEDGTVAAVIRAYQASPQYKLLSPSTRKAYGRYLVLAELPTKLGAMDVTDVRPSTVRVWLDEFADRPATQRLALASIKAVEEWAVVRDHLPGPITTGLKADKSGGGHTPWSEAQVALAEASLPDHMARVIVMKANTGQRGSDLRKMKWSDLEEVEGRLGINVEQQKTGVEIWIPFTTEFAATVRKWRGQSSSDYILVKANGQPWRGQQFTNLFYAVVRKRADLAPLVGLVPHGLRATAAVRLRRAGATTLMIANMLGMSEQMVSQYLRLSIQKEEALAAVRYLEAKNASRTDANSNLRETKLTG